MSKINDKTIDTISDQAIEEYSSVLTQLAESDNMKESETPITKIHTQDLKDLQSQNDYLDNQTMKDDMYIKDLKKRLLEGENRLDSVINLLHEAYWYTKQFQRKDSDQDINDDIRECLTKNGITDSDTGGEYVSPKTAELDRAVAEINKLLLALEHSVPVKEKRQGVALIKRSAEDFLSEIGGKE